MYLSMNWLKDYVNIDIDTNEFADKMTMSGSMVEGIEKLGEGINKVVVGYIESIEKHPDADKLVVCKISIGEKTLQIVTGADNISEGDYIPVALHGSVLPGGVKIKKGKLRGEVSEGMLCSPEELGIPKAMIPEKSKDGIWILNKEYPVGEDFIETLNLKDEVVEFEITSNRPDCLSVLGMAREVGATLNETVKYPNIEVNEIEEKSSDNIEVEIEDIEGCTRYVARVVKNVKIADSPEWIQGRLIRAGVRPINNIVDITNYVMLEYGQPLHAFDMSFIEGNKIIVKSAKEDERFKTLDGVERKLKSSMTVISDANKSLAIAGVMGGEESEVTQGTKDILIESASFNSDKVRLTSKQVGLRTEASGRYEKGVDPNIARIAADRVCQLIEELGVGEVLSGAVDVYPEQVNPHKVSVRPKKINDLLGTSISNEEMVDIFGKLEIDVKDLNETIELTVPTYRKDLLIEADFAEEVGRIFGYDKIEPTMAKGNIAVGGKPEKQIIEDTVKTLLNSMSFNETLTYSFVSPKTMDMINVSENSIKRNIIKLLNPLGDETSVMRTSLLPNILEVASRNSNRNVKEFRAFEIGQIFIPKVNNEKELPSEIPSLVMAMYGEEDFFTLKGSVQTLLDNLGIKGYEFTVEKNHPSYHPGRCANIIVEDKVLGTIGELHPIVMDNYDLDQRSYCAEIDFSILIELTNMERIHSPLPKYPAIDRDFAVVVKDTIVVKEIEDIIKAKGGNILESFKLFDIYQGDQIEEGFKSVAYTIIYRNKERTLTDDEVNAIHNDILNEISQKLDGRLRE